MGESRKIAAEIAYNAIFGNEDVEPVVERVLRSIRPEYRKSLLFRELTVGAVRRAATLDAIARSFSNMAFDKIEPRVLSALRVGLYEIVFMQQDATFAAIAEISEYVRYWSPHAFAFVKGILHSVREQVGGFVSDEPGPKESSRTLPVRRSLWRRFSRDILPSPKHNLSEYLAVAYSLPGWLADKLLRQHGRTAQNIMATCNEPAPATIRANLIKNNLADLRQILASQGFSTDPGTQKQALLVREPVDPTSVPAYMHGRFSIEDEFDIAAVNCLNPRPGERVCVLQGKVQTMTHIAQAVTPGGSVLGCVSSPEEAQAAAAESNRLGLDSLQVVVLDTAEAPDTLNASFDRVFVEPPSTGVAKFRRVAAARWRIQQSCLPELVERQKLLLRTALELCAAGGIALYVTSSVFGEENEEVVDALTTGMHHLKVLESRLQVPSIGGPDGGFVAKIAKLNN